MEIEIMSFTSDEIEEVIKYWFGEDYRTAIKGKREWFGGKSRDSEITEKYQKLLSRVVEQAPTITSPPEGLMMILVLDQFSRHICRDDTPDNKVKRIFHDEMALMITQKMIQLNWDKELSPICRPFVLMPLRHTFQEDYIQQAINRIREYQEKEDCPIYQWFTQVSKKKLKESQKMDNTCD